MFKNSFNAFFVSSPFGRENVFNSIKKNDLLEDRVEYDEEDLQSSYPELNKKEAKLLYLKIQKWKYSKVKGKKNIALSNNKHS
ncbi:MAG: hypothetical protein NTZ83_00415 [Candidatus Pacearchaeota archaeon]|nr:hypothetical protein [Candidatus Pacearchaeota archaeon]